MTIVILIHLTLYAESFILNSFWMQSKAGENLLLYLREKSSSGSSKRNSPQEAQLRYRQTKSSLLTLKKSCTKTPNTWLWPWCKRGQGEKRTDVQLT